MSMTINLPADQQAALAAQAQAQGVSAEEYARQVLAHAIETGSSPPPRRRHISEKILEIMKDVPPEVMTDMPTDGASQHDHYIYGWPKRDA